MRLFPLLIISFLTSLCCTGLQNADLEFIVALNVLLEVLPFNYECEDTLLNFIPDILHDQFMTVVNRENVRKDIVTALGVNQISQNSTVIKYIISNLRNSELLIDIKAGLAFCA